MKLLTIRPMLDSLEDRHVPGNTLSMFSMPLVPPPHTSISSNKTADANVVESRNASHSNSGEMLTASRSAFQIFERQAYNTITNRAINVPDSEQFAPKLNSIFNEHGLQTYPGNLTNLKPLAELTYSPQFTHNSSAVPISDALPTPFASTTLTSIYSDSVHSTDTLASYLMLSDTASRAGRTIPKPQMILGNGTIDIACTTIPASGGNPEQILASGDKLHPGWLSNVNWSDNDDDGWSPASTKTTTADPAATYTPDKDDTYITGGDPDLRKFVIRVTDSQNTPLADFSFKLTFGSNVGVYYSNTKSGVVTSGHVFSNAELTFSGENGVITAIQTLWLEGRVASASFKDVELKAEYVGGNIPLNKTTDTVKVTVFGVEQTGLFAFNQQSDDPMRHSTPNGSNDENGQISWDLPRYLAWEAGTPSFVYCQYFHDTMEMQGTVKPPRDANPSLYYGTATHSDDPTIPSAPPVFPAPSPGIVTFSQERKVFIQVWSKKLNVEGWIPVELPPGITVGAWSPDIGDGQANTVTLSHHIYFIDGPGSGDRERTAFDFFQMYANFRNAVSVSIYGTPCMCSDWKRWHSQIFLKPKDGTYLTRVSNTYDFDYQDFGNGWIPIPTAPVNTYLSW